MTPMASMAPLICWSWTLCGLPIRSIGFVSRPAYGSHAIDGHIRLSMNVACSFNAKSRGQTLKLENDRSGPPNPPAGAAGNSSPGVLRGLAKTFKVDSVDSVDGAQSELRRSATAVGGPRLQHIGNL